MGESTLRVAIGRRRFQWAGARCLRPHAPLEHHHGTRRRRVCFVAPSSTRDLPAMRRVILPAASIAILIATTHAPALAAQTHRLVGAWKVDFPGGMRIENGTPTVMRLTGTLTVEAQADSLIATVVADPTNDGPKRPPLRLAAKTASGE